MLPASALGTENDFTPKYRTRQASEQALTIQMVPRRNPKLVGLSPLDEDCRRPPKTAEDCRDLCTDHFPDFAINNSSTGSEIARQGLVRRPVFSFVTLLVSWSGHGCHGCIKWLTPRADSVSCGVHICSIPCRLCRVHTHTLAGLQQMSQHSRHQSIARKIIFLKWAARSS